MSLIRNVGVALVVFLLPLEVKAELPIEIYTVAYEASSESLEAQIWVAKTIQNRMVERDKTARAVITQPKQFSWWGNALYMTPRTEKSLYRATQAWETAFTLHSHVNLYHDNSVKPRWANAKNVTFLCTIGKLSFYYEN